MEMLASAGTRLGIRNPAAQSGAADMCGNCPGNKQGNDGQAAQQLGRTQVHLLRWVAMCAVNARREEKMRMHLCGILLCWPVFDDRDADHTAGCANR